ncbi:twin-arginine translocation signal domain-containing protein [Streptomyces sp. NPDC056309]|uniref:twin-arginine translocation signal domain-containing protein n=1 Tax=unclassified Streptomyces TaxID=2593676 RepID=UPI0035E11FDC
MRGASKALDPIFTPTAESELGCSTAATAGTSRRRFLQGAGVAAGTLAVEPRIRRRRGPWRPCRSYSGALHLDAKDHARSTVCGSTADGMGAGEGGGLRGMMPPWQRKGCPPPTAEGHPKGGQR